MDFDIAVIEKDWPAVAWISLTMAAAAWGMAALDVAYAPIPMFAASIVAGLLFRGRPKPGAVAGLIAGICGGIPAEWAFHVVRLQNRLLNWAQLDTNEQFGLAVAELVLYAGLLAFFAAFFSWGAASDGSKPMLTERKEEASVPQSQQHLDIPIFTKENDTPTGPDPARKPRS